MSHVFYVLLFFVIKCSMPFLKDTAFKKKCVFCGAEGKVLWDVVWLHTALLAPKAW